MAKRIRKMVMIHVLCKYFFIILLFQKKRIFELLIIQIFMIKFKFESIVNVIQLFFSSFLNLFFNKISVLLKIHIQKMIFCTFSLIFFFT